jgi:hypothetical protein
MAMVFGMEMDMETFSRLVDDARAFQPERA